MNEFDRTQDYFTEHAEDYADRIMSIQPQLYKNTGNIINSIIQEKNYVLDIGNGGVINYSFEKLNNLICADLYISTKAKEKYKKHLNVQFTTANVLDLKHSISQQFDVVIIQAVLHHLAGRTYKKSKENIKKALCECLSVIPKGGKIIILESTVSGWFEKIERVLYPFMQLFFYVCRFGSVYQFSKQSLYNLLTKELKLDVIEMKAVEIDKYIWIMNHKILSKLTPCGLTFYLIEKN